MLAIFSAFPMFGKFQTALEKYFIQTLVPDTIAKPVLRALTQFAINANRLGTLGLVLLVVTALALMLTIDRTLNAIWRVRTPRPIAQRVLVYWAAATLGPLLLGVSLSMTSYALYASRGIVSDLPGGVSLLLNIMEFALTVGAVAGLFRYVPNTACAMDARTGRRPVRGRRLRVREVDAGRLPQAGADLLGAIRRLRDRADLPGMALPRLGDRAARRGDRGLCAQPEMKVVRRPATPGHVFLLAITLLRELHEASEQSIRGLSAAALSERLRTDPLQIEPILDELVALDWVGRLEEEGGARYVLLADPATTTAQPLLAQTLLDPSPSLRGFWQRASFGEMTLADLLQQ